MYKVLIVDDERMIRLGMQKAIPWQTMDVSEIHVAKSGEEALTLIEAHKPDIMITDIKMDGMTGLDLIDKALSFMPEMRILVLTGYDDFEYARRCIKLKVHDFFLKPIDETALMESVQKQIAALRERRTETAGDVHASRAHAVVEQMKVDRFLRTLVDDGPLADEADIAAFCDCYRYDRDQQMQAAVLVPALREKQDAALLNYDTLTIRNICIGMVDARKRGLTFLDAHGRIVIAFFYDEKQRDVLDWVQELNGILGDEYGKSPKIIIGRVVYGFSQLRDSYHEAIHLLNEGLEHFDEIILSNAVKTRGMIFQDVFEEMKRAIADRIVDAESVLRVFARFSQAVESYHLSTPYTRKCCFDLAAAAYYAAVMSNHREIDARLVTLLHGLANLEVQEMLEMTRVFLSKLTRRNESEQLHEIVEKAKAHILTHLGENLSVADIAATLYVTPNYLSRLFKKTTGEGCNEFIIRHRMEQAKCLLATTNMSISKIAGIVGYQDTNYFSMAVKKSTDMSPREYRNYMAAHEGEKPCAPVPANA